MYTNLKCRLVSGNSYNVDCSNFSSQSIFKPLISQNLIAKITIYMHTIDKFIQKTKTLWAISAIIASFYLQTSKPLKLYKFSSLKYPGFIEEQKPIRVFSRDFVNMI